MRTVIKRLIKLEHGSGTIQNMVLVAIGFLVIIFANKIWDAIKGPVSARVYEIATLINGGKANGDRGQTTPSNNGATTPGNGPVTGPSTGNGGTIQNPSGMDNPVEPNEPPKKLVPFSKEFREQFQKEVEILLNDTSLSDNEKTKRIIRLAKTKGAQYGVDPHDVVQDLRRKGWTNADKDKYNSCSLVYAHYFLKGEGLGRQGALGVIAGELGMSFYNDLLKLGGSWLADPWGEIDNRPASGYDGNNRRWYNQGVYVGWNNILPIPNTP